MSTHRVSTRSISRVHHYNLIVAHGRVSKSKMESTSPWLKYMRTFGGNSGRNSSSPSPRWAEAKPERFPTRLRTSSWASDTGRPPPDSTELRRPDTPRTMGRPSVNVRASEAKKPRRKREEKALNRLPWSGLLHTRYSHAVKLGFFS